MGDVEADLLLVRLEQGVEDVLDPPPPSPGASCLCLTYGRPHLLEEAVESFLRQDFAGPKIDLGGVSYLLVINVRF